MYLKQHRPLMKVFCKLLVAHQRHVICVDPSEARTEDGDSVCVTPDWAGMMLIVRSLLWLLLR